MRTRPPIHALLEIRAFPHILCAPMVRSCYSCNEVLRIKEARKSWSYGLQSLMQRVSYTKKYHLLGGLGLIFAEHLALTEEMAVFKRFRLATSVITFNKHPCFPLHTFFQVASPTPDG